MFLRSSRGISPVSAEREVVLCRPSCTNSAWTDTQRALRHARTVTDRRINHCRRPLLVDRLITSLLYCKYIFHFHCSGSAVQQFRRDGVMFLLAFICTVAVAWCPKQMLRPDCDSDTAIPASPMRWCLYKPVTTRSGNMFPMQGPISYWMSEQRARYALT